MMATRSALLVLVIALNVAGLAGCAAVSSLGGQEGPDQREVDNALSMLKPGETMRTKVLDLLGRPKATRGDHVYVYDLSEDLSEEWATGHNRYVRIEFDASGLITRIARYEGDKEPLTGAPPAEPEEDRAAKAFQPRSDACTAYVIFGESGSPRAESDWLNLDTHAVAPVTYPSTFQPGYYVVLHFKPGSHRLSVGVPDVRDDLVPADFRCDAGDIMFFQAGSNELFSSHSIAELNTAEGERGVLRRQLIINLLE
jgi:outer membrane protein assembly factor BamE (lipoprotein component of BamABCDE complex)